MRKSILHTTLLAAALACSSFAFAAAPPSAASTGAATNHRHMHRMHHGRHGMSMLDQLNLTDAQRTSVHQLMRQSFQDARPTMQTLRQKRVAFEKATPGSAEFQAAANDLAQAESSAAHARVLRRAELRTRIYNLLTPEQRTKYASIRAQREARMKQWRESHMQKHSGDAPVASADAEQ